MQALTDLQAYGYQAELSAPDKIRLTWTRSDPPDPAKVEPLLAELRARKAEALEALRGTLEMPPRPATVSPTRGSTRANQTGPPWTWRIGYWTSSSPGPAQCLRPKSSRPVGVIRYWSETWSGAWPWKGLPKPCPAACMASHRGPRRRLTCPEAAHWTVRRFRERAVGFTVACLPGWWPKGHYLPAGPARCGGSARWSVASDRTKDCKS
jgi:hypothetical protein